MEIRETTCGDFVAVLASKAPTPGGGGAAALAGAIGMALGNMVGSLTVGKKKYADVQGDTIALKAEADLLQADLLDLADKDAEVFAPLSKAYGLPSETEEEKAHKDEVMEKCLREACSVPLKIMEKCCAAIDLHGEFEKKGSVIAISDVGCGVILCKSALQAASLNVFINTKSMKDHLYAQILNKKAAQMLIRYSKKADEIYERIAKNLTRGKI